MTPREPRASDMIQVITHLSHKPKVFSFNTPINCL
jgi:hypothetical protein